MAQEIINTGATANDGTGDPLRTAFIKTDNNFDQIWAAGPVGSNVQISGNTITTTVVNTDLVLAPNGAANVRINNNTVPNANNIWYLGSATSRWRGVYVGAAGLDVTGNITAAYVTANNDLTVNGNLIVDGDVIQIGNIVTDAKTIQLANTAATDAQANGSGITVGANDDIATMLYNSTSDTWVMNIGANISGNVTAPYFIGNGSLLTGITGYGNANVAAYLPTYTGNIGADTVNVTGNILVAREIRLGTLPSGNLEIVDDTAFNGPGIKTPGGSGLDLLIEPSGNLLLSSDGGLVIVEDQTISTSPNTGALLVYGGVGINGNINAGGNVTANYFIGNGSQLTGLPASYGNANVAAYLPTYTGDITANNITVSRTIRVGTLPSGNLEIVDDTPGNGPAIKTPGGSGLDLLIEPSGNLLLSADGGEVIVEDQTPSLDPNTGALLVYGGIGVNGNINSGGNISAVGWTGNLIPSANAVYSLGNATNYWSNLWVANNTIYIGGVPLGVTGNTLTVNGEAVLSNDSDSSITTTGNLAAGNILTDNYFYANGAPFVSSSTGNITFTNTTMSPPDGEDLFITAANSEVEITGLDFRVEVTDDVRIQGNNIVSIRNISVVDPITIRTDYNGNDYSWEFDATGNLTTPGNIEVSGDITAAGQITGTSTASTLVLAAEPNSNTAIQLNDTVDSIISTVANLEVRTDVSNTPRLWRFDTNGDLTVPNYINFKDGTFIGDEGGAAPPVFRVDAPLGLGIDLTTDSDISGNNYTWSFGIDGILTVPGDLVGSGASPAPSLSGFDSLSAISANLSGNVTANYFIGDGSQLTGLPASYTDSNVVSLLSAFGSNTISTTGNITAANFIGNVTLTGNITGSSANVELAANAYVWTFDNTGNTTFANGTVSANDITLTGNISANTAGYAIGYRDIPQVSFTGNATIAITDAGKHYYSTESTDYILTIANNASENFQVGAAISVVNQGTGNITIAQGSGVSLYLAGNATSGNRNVTTFGMATIMKVATDTWFINGTGVS